VVVDDDLAGPRNSNPLLEEPPIGAEELKPAVFTIGNDDCVVWSYGDSVRYLELSRSTTRPSPGE
jgi:hypothetical protein